MKKIFLLVFAFVMCKIGYAQYPMTQFIGTDSAIVVSKGAMQSRFVNVVFADTTTANSQRIKQYPGAMIYAAGKLWYRNATATGWVELTSTSTDTNIYNSDGTLTGPRTLNGNNDDLTFDNMAYFSVNANPSGQVRFYQGSNNNILMRGDTTAISRRLSYNTNLGSSFTKHSLIDKNYVDSSFSLNINGTTNYLPKFTSSSAIGNSQIFDNGTNVGIGTATPSVKFESNGRIRTTRTGDATQYIDLNTDAGGHYILANGASKNLFITNASSGFSGIIFNAAVASDYVFQQAGTGKMTLSSDGILYLPSSSSVVSEVGILSGSGGVGTDKAGHELRLRGGYSTGSGSGGPITFYTSAAGSSGSSPNTLTEKIRITGDGSLAIGTTSPTTKLDVNGDLKVGTIANATTDTDRFIVSDGGVIKYRTGSEVLSDIGGAAASSISGTPNYIAKFTGSSSIGNTVLYEDGFSLGLGTTAPSPIATGFRSVTINGTNRAYVTLQVTGLDLGYFYAVPSTRVELSSQTALPLVFSTNATERMRLDASGNLGLGVTPSAWSNFRVIQGVGTSGNSAIAFNNSGGLDLVYNTFYNGTNFIYLTTGNLANRYTIEAGTYKWYTAPSGTAGNAITFTQAMTLDASGRLGIGLTNPAQRFVVRGQNGNSALEFDNKASNTEIVSYDRVASAYRDLYLHTSSASPTMVLNTSGNVGIGTTTPQTQLDIANGLMFGTIDAFPSATYDAAAVIAKTGSLGSAPFNNAGSIVYRARVTSTAGRSSHIFYTGSPSTERMRLDESGRLGIGTTTPNQRLTVGVAHIANTVMPVLKLTTTGAYSGAGSSDAGASVEFGQYHDTYPNWVLGQISAIRSGASWDGALLFYTNNGTAETNKTERMRITSGGDVGIGTTSPARKLEVLSSGAIPARVSTTNSNMAIEYISTAGTRYNWLAGAQYNVSGAFEITPSTAVGGTTFSTPAFVVTSGGDVGIGTTTPGTKLEVNGAIKTAAPSGGTAKPFKIGAAATVTPTSQNRTIEIEIDGTTYYLTAKTTND